MFISLRAAGLFATLSLIFFHITATTFASLGVVLPAMIDELEWSWTEAGFGFTALALFTGVFSPIAAQSLKRLGLRGNYALGGAVMASGFAMLSVTKGLALYLAAASLLGAGFALLANVPSVYVAAQTVTDRARNTMIGVYLAGGGLGGVAGPLIANALLSQGADWRLYWQLSLASILVLTLIFLAFADPQFMRAGNAETHEPAPEGAQTPVRDWTVTEALRAPAFYVIGGALMAAYFCGVSVSSWAVTHLSGLGLSMGFASAMLSLHAASNALARAAGGFAVKFIRARYLLLTGLAAEAIGMLALAVASDPATAIIFALFEGYAFGMILFATTVLQIEYFGLKNSPAILGAMNLFATVAMLGPVLTGVTGDVFGSFSPIFIAYGAIAAALVIAGLFIHNPNERAQ
ncbi:MFS transporter [Hyphococcus sp.]|uniref:MFS transporter n=1 Tax=Hyphococcus sp. TaxID=2038636 RepID=UPI003CCC3CD8